MDQENASGISLTVDAKGNAGASGSAHFALGSDTTLVCANALITSLSDALVAAAKEIFGFSEFEAHTSAICCFWAWASRRSAGHCCKGAKPLRRQAAEAI